MGRNDEIRARLESRGLRNFYTNVYPDSTLVEALDYAERLLTENEQQAQRIAELEWRVSCCEATLGLHGIDAGCPCDGVEFPTCPVLEVK